MELSTKFGFLKQLRVLAHLAACPECVAPCWLGFQSRLSRHTRLPSLRQCFGRNDFAHLPLRRVGSPVLESHRGVDGAHWSQTARAVGYVVDNVDPPYRGEKRVVFHAIQAVARTVIWETRKKGLYDGANLSLILFFRHQLTVKFRCYRKRLDCITFNKRWVDAASLFVRKGAMLESSFHPLPAHGAEGPGPSGPHPR